MSDCDIPLLHVRLILYLEAAEAISPTGEREFWLIDHRANGTGQVGYWAPHEEPGLLPTRYRRRFLGRRRVATLLVCGPKTGRHADAASSSTATAARTT